MEKLFKKDWSLERAYSYTIRNNPILWIIDHIICIGNITEKEIPSNKILSEYPFIRLFNIWNIDLWFIKKYR